jgi:hypothetical protein
MRIASKLNEKAVKTQLRDFSRVRRGRRQWQKGALNRGGDSRNATGLIINGYIRAIITSDRDIFGGVMNPLYTTSV